MIARVFGAVWFLSLLAITATLLYQYASFPQTVTLLEAEPGPISVSSEVLFYLVLASISILNVLIFPVTFFSKDPSFRAWFFGLITTLNIFLIISVSFITLYNSGEKYDYQRLEMIIQGSIGLFVFWTLVWPIYWAYKNFIKKSAGTEQTTTN